MLLRSRDVAVRDSHVQHGPPLFKLKGDYLRQPVDGTVSCPRPQSMKDRSSTSCSGCRTCGRKGLRALECSEAVTSDSSCSARCHCSVPLTPLLFINIPLKVGHVRRAHETEPTEHLDLLAATGASLGHRFRPEGKRGI